MNTHKMIQSPNHRWLRRSAFILLLPLSLYAISRTVHKPGRTSTNNNYELPMPGSLSDNSLANLSFSDNRGNIAISKTAPLNNPRR